MQFSGVEKGRKNTLKLIKFREINGTIIIGNRK